LPIAISGLRPNARIGPLLKPGSRAALTAVTATTVEPVKSAGERWLVPAEAAEWCARLGQIWVRFP